MAVIALIMTIGVASAQKCMYVWMKDGTHLSIPVSSFDSVGFYAPTYTLSVTTEGEGSVTGAGAYKIDTEVTLTATAASGYTFSQWSDGFYWSSAQGGSGGAYRQYFDTSYLYPQSYGGRYHGFSVRLVQVLKN